MFLGWQYNYDLSMLHMEMLAGTPEYSVGGDSPKKNAGILLGIED